MTDPNPSNLTRSYADDESAELSDAAREQIESDPRARAQVRFERTLRERVSGAMAEPVEAMPEGLAARVRDAIRGADAAPDSGAATDDRETAPVASGVERTSWWAPQKANVFAVAASLALVAGAILFGIFGRPIDRIGPDPGRQLVNDTAQHVSAEHRRCAAATHSRDGKAVWKTVAEATRNLTLRLGADTSIVDLSDLGYQFVGAGPCRLPGHAASAHLIYASGTPGEDGCPDALLSIFVVADDGQFGGGLDPAPFGWTTVGPSAECMKRVACSNDGALAYFVVCCDASRMKELSLALAERAR